MKKFFIFLFISMAQFCFAQGGQKKIDSLRQLIASSTNDSLRLFYQITIGDEFRNINADSAAFYAERLNKAIKNNHYLKHKAKLLHAFVISENGQYKEAAKIINASIPFFESIKDYQSLGIIYNALSNQYSAIGAYDKSIKQAQKTVEYATKSGDKELLIRGYFAMAIDYFEIKEYDKSVSYYKKALVVAKAINDKRFITYIHNNLANNYAHMGSYKEAIPYANKAIKDFTETGATRLLSYPYVNLGTAYKGLKNYKLSEDYYLKAIKIKSDNNDEKDLIITQGYLADLYLKQKRYNDAEKVALIGYKNAKRLHLLPEIESTSRQLSKAYLKQEDYKNAALFFEINSNIKDSLSVTEKSKELFRLQTKYETAEKENQILQQKNKIAEHELQLNNRKLWIIRVASMAVIVFFIGFSLYFKQRNKIRQQKKENELKLALNKIENQNKLQEQRLSISRDLHDNIGSQLTFIISSIDTTKQFMGDKDAKITSRLSKINDFTRETISELRDTIWAMNHSEITLKDLQARILNFIENAGKARENINFKFINELPKNQKLIFDSKRGMHIYRILQEAINNAIKHANPETITTTLRESNNELILKIADNGKGFNPNDNTQGNGLKSLKTRAESLKGSLQVDSSEKGTIITLKIPKHDI